MTKSAETGTNLDPDVTSSAARWRWVLALAAVWTLVQAAVNSVSVASDLAKRGVAFAPREPWIWEFSSAVGLLLWLGPVLWFDAWLRARVRFVGWRLLALAGASLVFSVGHVVTMVALRHLAYRAGGGHYQFGPWLDGLLYEYRKDVLTFAWMVAVATALRLIADRRGHGAPPVAPPPETVVAPTPTFLVRTATQGDLLVRAEEVDWVEAQGNYVALHVGTEVRLLRQTLAEVESRLQAHGFIRTHRRALVNRARMQAITPERGELGVRLSSGQVAPLSESRRAEVLRLVLGA